MGVGVVVVGLAENIAPQPSLAGAWAELGKNKLGLSRAKLKLKARNFLLML